MVKKWLAFYGQKNLWEKEKSLFDVCLKWKGKKMFKMWKNAMSNNFGVGTKNGDDNRKW